MNCLDCQNGGREQAAVAVCTICGAAVCADHAHIADQPLTRPTLGGMVTIQVPVTPTARIIRCGRCAAAHAATRQRGHPARQAGHPARRTHPHPMTTPAPPPKAGWGRRHREPEGNTP